ncbi:hypothetical protein [Streptomyces poriferorum]|uniref:Uncharacterized protein n=1 Tax=Streptomyces poriferorum TaxID=2798799 RepID=A0ABY9J0C4_9ACTN|nr:MULTISPECIES: hypothetical protein [unclassified Streptomyces]MDP5310361.1 hypothetical protein [Streptomyces sp. Alt4]WLQ60484.1 hypothetical protein P8A19_35905 [Streptomyces sp. Alt2]
MTTEKPVRFTVPLKASFREKFKREKVIGEQMRWSIEDSVMMQGVVVDWQDDEDGGITLTVEAASPEE